MADKLTGVHPSLIAVAHRIQRSMAELNLSVAVTDGFRTVAQQAELYAQGRTTHGAIVTQCDGVKTRSQHQVQADGFGHAVDFCFLVDGKPSWSDELPWRLLGEMAKSQGCLWGGDWKHPDRPHIEWP